MSEIKTGQKFTKGPKTAEVVGTTFGYHNSTVTFTVTDITGKSFGTHTLTLGQFQAAWDR